MDTIASQEQTPVGTASKSWKNVLLDSVARRGSGHTPNKAHPEYWGGRIKWISLQDSDRLDRRYIYDTTATITPAGLANSSAKLHPKGTVVLSRDAGVGKSAIMSDDMAVSQHFMAWTCGPLLNNHYLYYRLQANKAEFERIAMGNTIKTIGLPYFKKLIIPLPTKAEQEAIAETLSDADTLIESLEQLIAKKRLLKQGAMQDLLTGKRRLPGFSGEWEVKRLGDVAEIVMGQSPSSAFYNTEGVGLPLIQGNADVRARWAIKRVFTSQITKRGLAGDILMSVRAPVGEVSRTSFEVCLGRGVCAIRHSGEFLYHALIALETTWAKHSKGSTFDSVNSTDVKALELAFPPAPNEREAIADVLTDIDLECENLEARLGKARQIKKGMMQELLTGRTRLI